MPYNPALDGIRAIAIALVLARHAQVPGFGAGFYGVDVFFVLSGYLITTILLNEIRATGSIALGRFYLRRLERLYPPMLAVLLAYVTVGPLVWPGLETPWVHAGIAAVYLSDYAHVMEVGAGKLSYLWSLAVEEKFYLLWPVLLLFVAARTRPLAWIAVLILASVGWRFLQWADAESWTRLYYCFDTHASGLMIGSGLALLLQRTPLRTGNASGLAAFGVLLLCAQGFEWRGDGAILWGILVAELAAVALILSAQAGTGWLATRPMAMLGRYSYGLYLWHMPIMIWLRDRHDWPVTLVLGSLFGLLASALSYHTIEAYFRERNERRRRSMSPSGAGAASAQSRQATPP